MYRRKEVEHMQEKKGQSSFEYLFIVVLALVLIIPASYLFFDFSKSSEDTVLSSQIDYIGHQILSASQQVFAIGNNSRITVEISLPENFENVKIYGEQELVFSYHTQSGISQAVFFTDINITAGVDRCPINCTLGLNPGKNNLRVNSRGDYVSLDVS